MRCVQHSSECSVWRCNGMESEPNLVHVNRTEEQKRWRRSEMFASFSVIVGS